MFSPQKAVLRESWASMTTTSPGLANSRAMTTADRSPAMVFTVRATPANRGSLPMGRRSAYMPLSLSMQSVAAQVTESY